ncbi:MAG: PQQ-dependent sugar dehydrogenase [Bacteroidia bacterium]|nr:PQQ-dependent sugar dehydrogenase [Bacteroidia bacterium]
MKHFTYGLLLFLILSLGMGCGEKGSFTRKEKSLLLVSNEEVMLPQSFIAALNDIKVDTTRNLSLLNEENLRNYSGIVFFNYNPDTIAVQAQSDIERYVQAGGGLLAINSPTSSPYYWAWYHRIFSSDTTHSSVIPVSNTSGNNAAISQILYDGGKVALVNFALPEIKPEDWAQAISFIIGKNTWSPSKIHSPRAPSWSRFTKVVLDGYDVDEPMELAVLPDGKVIYIERKGKMKLYDPALGKSKLLAKFDVCTEGNYEDGLLGLTIDPEFEDNHLIYLYYSPPCEIKEQYLSQFYLHHDSLILASEKVILKVAVQRETCCHSGGSVKFGPDGNLYLSTGDNTSSKESDGYTPIDERPGRYPYDAQKSSANTHDLRGKILRIKPTAYGTYQIPDGNLFPKDGSQGRPEIYIMGARNPFRIAIDPKTHYLYWGDVGPDVGENGRYGPESFDEWNQAKKPGYYGWPYFVGDNKAYPDRNFESDEVGELFNPERPLNNSPHNTGVQLLPPAQKAYIWYPKGISPEFPMLGKGSNSAMAGPIYYQELFPENSRVRFPEYYNGKFFIYEWARSWIKVVTMDPNGNVTQIEPFLPEEEFVKPIEMEFGPDGALYMLEYGQNYFLKNPEARLVRIEYAAGNRLPVPKITADKKAGAAPMTVSFSAEGSRDYDEGDSLRYAWYFTGTRPQANGKQVSYTFEKPGIYPVKMVATDMAGESEEVTLSIQVGNQPPEIDIQVAGNQQFFFDTQPRPYQVSVSDKEEGTIDPTKAMIRLVYIRDGNDLEVALGGSSPVSASLRFVKGQQLIQASDCKSCHDMDKSSVGPSYLKIAEKYEASSENINLLAEKILSGGNGVWGEKIMAGHPQHTLEETREMTRYILSLGKAETNLPSQGLLSLDKHEADETGAYLFSVTYSDKGANGITSLSTRKNFILKAPYLSPDDADEKDKIGLNPDQDNHNKVIVRWMRENAFLHYKQVDMTGVKSLSFRIAPEAGGTITIRKGSLQGEILGTLTVPSQAERGKWIVRDAQIQAADGNQDIYFIFDRPQQPDRNLMQLEWIGLSDKIEG